MRTDSSTRPVTGYGLTFYRDHNDHEVCAFLDGSPVLVPSRIEQDGGSRRFRFNEGFRELRQAGDIFCADAETAGLVREALNEKFERDRDNANAFRVTSATLAERGTYQFLRVKIELLTTAVKETFSFTLDAPNVDIRNDGRAEFTAFVLALGLSNCDDTEQLVGRTGNFVTFGERRVFKRWVA